MSNNEDHRKEAQKEAANRPLFYSLKIKTSDIDGSILISDEDDLNIMVQMFKQIEAKARRIVEANEKAKQLNHK